MENNVVKSIHKKNILVIGKGFLGNIVFKTGIQLGYNMITTHQSIQKNNSHFLDISEINQVEKIIKSVNPDYVINLAARGDIDFLETHPDIAKKVNCLGAGNVAKICSENNIRILHVSTDSVFDGIKGMYSESDTPNPINVYSRSKYEGELEVSKNSKDHVIIRTNFYGINQRDIYFFNWILNNIKTKTPMIGFTDIIFSPLDIHTLSTMILELIESSYIGIIHLSSGQPISKFEFIKSILKQLSIPDDILKIGRYDDQPFVAHRPKNTSLKNDLAKKILKTPIIDFHTWIEKNRKEINRYLK